MSASPRNRRFLLMRRPKGIPVADDFLLTTEPLPEVPDGRVLVRNHYVSLDPAMRGWMDDRPSYFPPIPLGTAMRGATVGVVVDSRAPGILPGQWVYGFNAIEDYSISDPAGYFKVIDITAVPSPTNYLSVLGLAGMTAYFGLLEVCRPAAGDVVLVSGAAGAVGSVVGQIAKIKGASRVIGIAGGAGKCARVVNRYGFDAAIDYRDKSVDDLSAEIRAQAPDGINIVFENVGGDVLDAALNNLALNARLGICGLISEYNNPGDKTGARNIWQLIVKRASMRGLLVADYMDRFPQAAQEMSGWLRTGQLRFDEHIEYGIENCLSTFLRLFSGDKEGKLLLKLAP
jgi:NADPH-dependent curcumin reductase CurA